MTGKLPLNRVLESARSTYRLKPRFQLKDSSSCSYRFTAVHPPPSPLSRGTSLVDVVCKACLERPPPVPANGVKSWRSWIHSSASSLDSAAELSANCVPVDGGGNGKVKRKKLKGKRAVVRWLRYFRWKKKKEYDKMTNEEKILYKLTKARRKEERLVAAMSKIEPSESSETTHDPEILTPEEHFFFLKMGIKCKNYVPVGRRGIYQGVILNMHLHWKKHQTLKVVVKTFPPEEVKELAAELARLSGGIVLDIHDGNEIIMYRGKNYVQPPTEIMSPRVTLTRKKALDKSKYKDALRAIRRHIPRLEQELDLLRVRSKFNPQSQANATSDHDNIISDDEAQRRSISSSSLQASPKLKQLLEAQGTSEDESGTDDEMTSDSEDLSDIFETDSDSEETNERPLYLDQFEKFPVRDHGEPEDFEEYLKKVSGGDPKDVRKDAESPSSSSSPSLDEVDRMFIRAASLLRNNNKRRNK